MKEKWTREQVYVVIGGYLGWMLDAFDFFLLVFVLKEVAHTFAASMTSIALALTLTLAFRPVGAFLFGRLADKLGRRLILTINIALFALFELLTGFAPNLMVFLILRALFGIAMGGEWGVATALVMESIPKSARGAVSGLLQAGYNSGYLVAAIVFGVFYQYVGWRGMFFIGVIPAILVVFIRMKIPESPAWAAAKTKAIDSVKKYSFFSDLKRHWKITLFSVVLMFLFNAFSHGSQDLYPSFLGLQRHFSIEQVAYMTIVLNLGAIVGGIFFGFVSQLLGRKLTVVLCALLVLPVIPLWLLPTNIFWMMAGAFLLQFFLQGAWGVVPAYLSEVSPTSMRATFPGFVYQLGVFIASVTPLLQTKIAVGYGNNFSLVLGWTTAIVAVVLLFYVLFGPEKRNAQLTVD